MKITIPEVQAIQMIGTQRSGSNLLRVMLNQSPEIVAPHPPHILEIFSPLVHLYGNLDIDRNFKSLIIDVCRLVKSNPVSWEVQLLPDEIYKRAKSRSLYEIFRVVYATYAESKNCQYWCCKSMNNVRYINELEAHRVKPYYIHLIRDGRDVALSFKKAAVGDKHLYSLARRWSKQHEMALKFRESVATDRYIQVVYEALLENPSKVLKKVCSFLNISYNDSLLQFHQSEESNKTASAGRMWENLQRPLLKGNKQKFLNEMSRDELLLFESVAGKTLNKLGYTIYHGYNGHALTLSDDQIFQYEKENNLLKSMAQKTLSERDTAKRKAQNDFITELRNRLHKGVGNSQIG